LYCNLLIFALSESPVFSQLPAARTLLLGIAGRRRSAALGGVDRGGGPRNTLYATHKIFFGALKISLAFRFSQE
jgi:hypothetical protein